VLDTLDKCRKVTNVKLLGYVLLPEHFHLVAWSEVSNNVRVFIRQFLRDSSSDITDLAAKAAQRGDPTAALWLDRFRNRAGQGTKTRIWKERGRAFPVTLGDGLYQKLAYIHLNPVSRDLVDQVENWEFSSAAWYAGKESIIIPDGFDF
jgi:REP element-mobilizing transposase RayT